MERIIKFRGRTDGGKWMKGNLVCYRENGEDVTCIVSDERRPVAASLVYTPVDPATVGQFTALSDKKNRGIYEGDIVECVSWNEYFTNPETGDVMTPFRRRMYVDFRKGGFKMVEPLPSPMTDNEWDIICNGDVEVVGNIYDNPELLDKED